MSTKIAGATFALGLLGLVLPAPPAAALDPDNWMRFPGTVYASQSDPTERAFVREWEAEPPKGYPTLSRDNVAATKAAIKRYSAIVAAGGWKPLPVVPLQSGSTDPAVAILLQRLLLSGDLREEGSSEYFDYYVAKAVRRYQASNGLAPTGIVDKHTIQALNVPAAARLKQLKVNLERLSEPGAPRRKEVRAREHPGRANRSGARATTSFRGMPAWWASPTGRPRCSRPRSMSSTSMPSGTCRPP